METNNIELLEAYLEGTLSAEQQTQVENRLKADDAFRADYDMYRLMLSAISENRKTELKSFIIKNVKVKSTPFFRTPTFYAAAAASVVLCLISYFVIYNKLVEQNTVAQAEKQEVRSEPTSVSKTDTAQPLVEKESTQNKESHQAETSQSTAEKKSGAVAFEDTRGVEQRGDDDAASTMDNISSNPNDLDQIKVESDKMQVDTILFISRKIYIAKPKQFQANANDLYTVITTGDKLKLEVQFWKSPISYNGYKFVNQVLIIYGNYDPSLAYYQELKEVVYLKYKNEYYRISPTETFTGMKKETDSKVIADLEIKDKK